MVASFRTTAAVLWLVAACTDEPATEPSPPTPTPGGGGGATRSSAEECEAIAHAALRGEPMPRGAEERVRAEPIAFALRDIYDCRAVALDDVEACAPVLPRLHANCRARWRFFHDARAASPSYPTAMAEGIYEDCRNPDNGIDEPICARLRDAIRMQATAECDPLPDEIRNLCRALASSDPSPCPDDDCRELAGRLAMLAEGGGLGRVAREGTPRDRIAAAAALSGLDACEPLVPTFRAVCTATP